MLSLITTYTSILFGGVSTWSAPYCRKLLGAVVIVTYRSNVIKRYDSTREWRELCVRRVEVLIVTITCIIQMAECIVTV